jgi:NmrA-like family
VGTDGHGPRSSFSTALAPQLSIVNIFFCAVAAVGAYYFYISREMSSAIRPVVAIAGGTGQLGSHIMNALLSPQFSPSFKEIRLLTSNVSSEKAQLFASKGAKTIGVNYSDEQSILTAIQGADVLINSLGGSVKGFPAKNALMLAAIKDGGIKLYFPSEFGIGMILRSRRLT